ncbi:alpha/beta hydrolase [Actinoplanes sp. NPDC049668]|uniref:alpha/beta hydrolase n=1 Tax=unclassified Actinoplanes TaxID=2626549 RepID=UPI0033AA06BA
MTQRDAPLMIFVHGWPELGLVWRAQVEHFTAAGWHCVAPDLRGYGTAAVPERPGDYALEHIVGDMLELHDSLGGAPAVWVGHDWGSPVVWSLATHHPERVRAAASLCVPYLPAGFALETLVDLVDRDLYPERRFPYGQWDYYRYYAEDFDTAVADFDADVAATVSLLYRGGRPDSVGRPTRSSQVRANGGWFGPARRTPLLERDASLLSAADHAALVAALSATGFRGPCSWYANDEANLAYAARAPHPRLEMPVLFVHAAWDGICETRHSRLADPMRAACADLTEATVDAGHEVMLQAPAQTNAAIAGWLSARRLAP